MSDTAGDSIGQKVADGAKKMLILRLVERVVGVASFSILARVLMPEDFGLVALAMSTIAVIELFGQAGIDLALIQRRNVSRDQYDTAWTINLLIGLCIALVILLLAHPLAALVNETRIEVILYWLAGASALGGLYNVGTADFRKHFEFGKEFRFRFSIRVIRTAVTVGLALLWRDYWALVAGYLAGTVAMVFLSYVLHPYRPRLSLRAFASFRRFSGWMLARNILKGMNDHLVNLVIGRLVGAGGLGFFSSAREISSLATTEVQAPIRRALFPGFAALSNDPQMLLSSYLRWTAIMVLLALPIPAGLALVAADVVLVLMGDKWLPAVPLIQILACAGILRAFASGAQSMLIAIGLPHLSAKLAAIRFVLLIPLVVLGTHWAGAIGAAWAMLATSTLMHGINFTYVVKTLHLNSIALLRVTYRPVIATLTMAAAVWYVSRGTAAGSTVIGAIQHLLIAAITGAAVYSASLLALWSLAGRPDGAERDALNYLSSRFAPGRSSGT